MHLAMALLWPLSVLIMFVVGGFLGLLMGVYKGGELSHTYARHFDRTCERCADEQEQADEDWQDRLDALAIRDLIRSSTRIWNDSTAGFTLRADYKRQLGEAIEGCERLHDWIEWAEGATETKTALAVPADAEAAV